MKISVAMTTYNGEKYVREQLASLLGQTRTPDEVIIVDDCSKDSIASIVKSFIEENGLMSSWHFYSNKENLGYKKNFYEAISKTTGDIIFLCDQDDFWRENKIEVMGNIFANKKNVKALNTSFNFVNAQGQEIGIVKNPKYSNNNIIKFSVSEGALVQVPLSEVCCYGISPGCTMAFRKEIKDIYLKRSRLEIVHDWEINFIAAIYDGLYFLNTPTINYRIHGDNVMGITAVNGKMSGKDKVNIKLRLKEAEKNYNIVKNFEKYFDLLDEEKLDILAHQLMFNALRMDALKHRSLGGLLKLFYKYRSIYKKSNSFKGQIADLVCMLLPERIFE